MITCWNENAPNIVLISTDQQCWDALGALCIYLDGRVYYEPQGANPTAKENNLCQRKEYTVNIHVGNLAKTTKKEALVQLFESYGKVVAATIARDKKSGASRGFGYVEMATRHEGEEAIAHLNDKEFEGQKLHLSEAHERKEKAGRGSGKGDNRFDQQRSSFFSPRGGQRNAGNMRRSGRRGS